jgi:hypothetical protein
MAAVKAISSPPAARVLDIVSTVHVIEAPPF